MRDPFILSQLATQRFAIVFCFRPWQARNDRLLEFDLSGFRHRIEACTRCQELIGTYWVSAFLRWRINRS